MKSMIIPIGDNCAPASWLNMWKLRTKSYPLDWIKCADDVDYSISSVESILLNDFNNFFKDIALIRRKTPDGLGGFSSESDVVWDIENGLYDLHLLNKVKSDHKDDSNLSIMDEYENLINRRVIRYLNDIKESDLITFISMRNPYDTVSLINFVDNIADHYKKNITLINIEFRDRNDAYRIDHISCNNGDLIKIVFDEKIKTDFYPWFGIGTLHRNSCNYNIIKEELKLWIKQ